MAIMLILMLTVNGVLVMILAAQLSRSVPMSWRILLLSEAKSVKKDDSFLNNSPK